MVSRCLPHQWRFECDTWRNRTVARSLVDQKDRDSASLDEKNATSSTGSSYKMESRVCSDNHQIHILLITIRFWYLCSNALPTIKLLTISYGAMVKALCSGEIESVPL